MIRRRPLAAGLAALALLVSACGDDDGAAEPDETTTSLDGEAAELRDAFVAELSEEIQGDPQFPIDGTQAECFAVAVVDTIGSDRLDDAGLTPAGFAGGDMDGEAARLLEERREEIADAVADCELSGVFASALGLRGDAETCFTESIDEEELASLLVGAALGEEDRASGEAFGGAIMANLPGPCAKLIAVDLLADGVGGEASRVCIEENLSEELAGRLLDPQEQAADAAGLEAEVRAVLTPCL